MSSAASCYRKGYACTGHGDGAAQYRLQQAAASTDNVERDKENGKPPQKPQGQPQHRPCLDPELDGRNRQKVLHAENCPKND
jgi:hypothetical protein